MEYLIICKENILISKELELLAFDFGGPLLSAKISESANSNEI
jgi:hypothetical protein